MTKSKLYVARTILNILADLLLIFFICFFVANVFVIGDTSAWGTDEINVKLALPNAIKWWFMVTAFHACVWVLYKSAESQAMKFTLLEVVKYLMPLTTKAVKSNR